MLVDKPDENLINVLSFSNNKSKNEYNSDHLEYTNRLGSINEMVITDGDKYLFQIKWNQEGMLEGIAFKLEPSNLLSNKSWLKNTVMNWSGFMM